MDKNTDGVDLSQELGGVELNIDAKIQKNALYFRQGIAAGSGTLPDKRNVQIEAAMNVDGKAILISITPEGGKDWYTYVFMTNDLIQSVLADFTTRFPVAP